MERQYTPFGCKLNFSADDAHFLKTNESKSPTASAIARVAHMPVSATLLILRRLVRAWTIFSKINGTLWASSFSYYAFFALFPLLAFFVAVAAHFTDTQRAFQYVIDLVARFMPIEGADRDAIGKTVDNVINAREKIGALSLVGLMWSAIGFFQAAVGGINAAWNQEPLNWWHLPLKNLLMLGVVSSAVLFGVAALGAFNSILAFAPDTRWSPLLLQLANFAVTTGVLFYGFLFFYKFAPRRSAGATFADVWIPALLADFLLQGAQRLFVIYALYFGKFNAVYGAFGVVIALMLWIYLSGVIIVFCGCLCVSAHKDPDSADGRTPSNA